MNRLEWAAWGAGRGGAKILLSSQDTLHVVFRQESSVDPGLNYSSHDVQVDMWEKDNAAVSHIWRHAQPWEASFSPPTQQ